MTSVSLNPSRANTGKPTSGIISLLLSILSLTELVSCLMLSNVFTASQLNGFKASSIIRMAIVLIPAITGLISGIAGTHKKNIKNTFCSAGIILNSLIIMSFAGLVITYMLLLIIFNYLSL